MNDVNDGVAMVMSVRMTPPLPLIFLLMIHGVNTHDGWNVNYNLSNICALKGSSVIMPCTYKYPPGHQIEKAFWTKHDVKDTEPPDLSENSEYSQRVQYLGDKQQNCTLKLRDVVQKDAGVYYFRYITDKDKWMGKPGVTLKITDLQVETPERVKEGDSVSLRCKTTCTLTDTPTFIWFRNTQPLTERSDRNNELLLQSVRREDAGSYSCAVQGQNLTSPAVTLYVTSVNNRDGWDVSYSLLNVCVLKGSSVIMPCFYQYPPGHQIKTVFWTKHDVIDTVPQDLSEDSEYSQRVQYLGDKQQNCTLRLRDVTQKDSHMYYFRFTTNKDKWMGKPGVTLKITDLQVETPERVKEGDLVTLRCKTTCNLTDTPTFIWFRNTQPLTERSDRNNELLLQSVRREDAGSYSCAVQNLTSPAVTLYVTYKPRDVSVSISPSGEIVEGSSVTLTCSSDSNPPAHEYSWFKGRKSVASGNIYSISRISSDHSGEYKCKAINKHGEKYSDAVILNVLYKPRNVSVFIRPDNQTVEISSVNLTCSSDSNPPVQNYTWFKENEPSPVGSGQRFSALQSGWFYCVAQNEYGSQRSAAVSVTVKGSLVILYISIGALVCGAAVIMVLQIYRWMMKRNDTLESQIDSPRCHYDRHKTEHESNDPVYENVPSVDTNQELYENLRPPMM